jgi:hypothetical protein
LVEHDHYESGNDYDDRCNLKSGFHLGASIAGIGNSSRAPVSRGGALRPWSSHSITRRSICRNLREPVLPPMWSQPRTPLRDGLDRSTVDVSATSGRHLQSSSRWRGRSSLPHSRFVAYGSVKDHVVPHCLRRQTRCTDVRPL